MRIVLYTNILTPYRKYFFDTLFEQCRQKNIQFTVLVMAETESNRLWRYEEYQAEYTMLLAHKTVSYKGIYIHYNSDLKEKLLELKPTHVICAGGYLCPGINKVLKLKSVLNYETYFWSESHLNEMRNYLNFLIKIREAIRKSFYNKFDGFWYAGKMSLEFIEKYSYKKTKKIFVPNIVDNKIFDWHFFDDIQKKETRKKYKIEADKLVFICPARLSTVKGIDKFINIVKDYPKKDNFLFVLAGDGELKDSINDVAQKYNINIRILGYLPQKEIAKLYSVGDFFLMPSLSDPNPLTCIEAIWAGLPLLVSSHVGNYPEIIDINENGFVFNYDDIENIFDILDRIVSLDKEWYESAKNKSYSKAQNNYQADTLAIRIINELKYK